MGCRLEVLGLENVPKDRACLLLGNHESLFDVFAVGGALPRFAVGLEAAHHLKMPVWGRITRAWGQLSLPEGRMAEARETFEQAAAILASGTDVIILPEGHRTRTGNIGDLKKGAFHMALAAKADILPFVQQGLYEFHNTHSWRLYPRRLRVIYGEPIPFESFKDSSVEELRDRVRETLLELDKRWEAGTPER
jgi:1-acyl-sn-glycerol-3-phosphate acyltransferase